MHLVIDGYGGDPGAMQDEQLIYQLLDRYPGEIGMTKISSPFVMKYVGLKPEDWGISGFVLIAESHISIHTFVERCYVNIDVFSCKQFDADRIIADIKDQLKLKKIQTRLLERGLEYPHIVEQAARIVKSERLQAAGRGNRHG